MLYHVKIDYHDTRINEVCVCLCVFFSIKYRYSILWNVEIVCFAAIKLVIVLALFL